MSLWSRRFLQTEAMKRMYMQRSVKMVSIDGGQEEDVHAEVNIEEDIPEVHLEVEEVDGVQPEVEGIDRSLLLLNNNDAGALEFPPP